MEGNLEESWVANENDPLTTFHKNEEDIWNNSSYFFASTDCFINNFTNVSDLEREEEFMRKLATFDNVMCEKPLKNKIVNETETAEKINTFIVNKRHTYKCRHLSQITNSIRKNKIKLSLEDDFRSITENSFSGLKNSFLAMLRNLSPQKTLDKPSKNRKFRLFDKDVVVKKIISHFYKFLSYQIGAFEKQYKVLLEVDNIVKMKKRSQTSFKSILDKRLVQVDKFAESKQLLKFRFLTVKLVDQFREYFLNSHYFQEIIENFKKKHGESYSQYFISICSEFPDCILNKSKNFGKKGSKALEYNKH